MKIAVFYYSQSGQATRLARSLFGNLEGSDSSRVQAGSDSSKFQASGVEVVYKEIQTELNYPYPWDKNDFFDVFPETRLGISLSPIRPMDLRDVADADLVVVVGQSWFLSPSQPILAFLTDSKVREYLRGREVVFVNGCRNMWLMTYRKVRAYVEEAGARLVGHIVLQDEHSNLISVLTIVRWLMFGRQEASLMLPRAGVSEEHMAASSRFGRLLVEAVAEGQTGPLQSRLCEAGAIHYKASILFLERTGHRIFGFWAPFIRKRGEFGDRRRLFRINLFFYYLLFVLFVVSPFAQALFYLTYPLRGVKREAWRVTHLED